MNRLNVYKILVSLSLLTTSVTADELEIVFTHENPAFGELLKEFSTQYDHEVKVTWVDQSDLKSRLVGLLNVSDVPDMLIIPSDSLGMDQFAQFSEIPDSYISSALSNKALQTTMIEGRTLGVPIVQGNHLLLYYNKHLIESPATNWQQLLKQHENLPEEISLISWSFMEMYWFVPFINAFGAGPVVNDQPDLDTNAMRDALAFAWNLANSGVVDQRCNYGCAETRFMNGESAYLINGIWSYQNYSNTFGDDLGVAQLPAIGNKPMKPYFSTIVAAFPRGNLDGPKKEAIQSMITYLQSDSFQRKLWDSIQEIPSNEKVLDDIIKTAEPELIEVLKTLDNTLPMSSHRNMAIIWEVILKGYLRYGSGIWSAERTSEYMQNLANTHIEKKKNN